jgi:hypothetical protein
VRPGRAPRDVSTETKNKPATYMVVQRESRRKKKSDRAELTQVTDSLVGVRGRWSMSPQTRPKSFLKSTTFSLSDSRSKKSRQKNAAVTGLSNHADFLSGRIRPTGNGRVAAAYPRIQVTLTVPGLMAGHAHFEKRLHSVLFYFKAQRRILLAQPALLKRTN